MFDILCLMVSGVRLSDDIRTVLFCTALDMVREHKDELKLVGDSCQGRLTTDFRVANLGCSGGTVFEAEIDTIYGSGKVRFIARDVTLEDLKRGRWIEIPVGRQSRSERVSPSNRYVN